MWVQAGTATTCASGIFTPVETSETFASTKSKGQELKVQRSEHKVQRTGPASALVGTGCGNNTQLQPPSPPTMQICPTQHDVAITATCVRARFVG